MSGLTETVRVMVRGAYEVAEETEPEGTPDTTETTEASDAVDSSEADVADTSDPEETVEETDEMGEPVITWTPVDVPDCLVRPKYKDADADAVEPLRPDAAELTVFVAMSSKNIDFKRLRGAKLRFPDRFTGDDLEAYELNVVGMPWPTPQSPLQWDILVEAEAQHG